MEIFTDTNLQVLLIAGVLAIKAFWLVMLLDCIRHEPPAGNRRLLWVAVIILFDFIGAIIYYSRKYSSRTAVSPVALK